MKYTKNYKLPQWVEPDRIMMEDFNQMCADIDAGLTAIQETAKTANAAASEGAEKIGALETRVTAVEQDVKFVKLAGPVSTAATGQSITFNLTSIKMTDYAALIIVVQGMSSGGEPISVNGSQVMRILGGGSSNGAGMGWLQPDSTNVYGMSFFYNGQSGYPTNSEGAISCPWAGITNINIGSNGMYAGTKCILYGIKA